MGMEIKPFSSQTLKRLLRVADVKLPSIKPRKSVTTPTSPLNDVVEENDQLVGAENTNEDVDVAETDIVRGAGEEIRSTEMKAAAEVGNIDAEVQHKSSTHLSVKVDAAINARDSASGEAENRRSPVKESRDFAGNESRISGISDTKDANVKDADGRISDLKFDVGSELSGQESSSHAATPRLDCI